MQPLNRKQKLIYVLLKYSDWPGEALRAAEIFGRRKLDRNTLRVLGQFAVGNDSYYIRYSQRDIDESVAEGILRVLSDPVENMWELKFLLPEVPSLKRAYEGLAGLVLNYFYREYNIIPVDYKKGTAVFLGDLPGNEEQLWCGFLEWLGSCHSKIIVDNLRELFESMERVGGLLFPLEVVNYFGEELRTAVREAKSFYNDRFIQDKESGEVLMDEVFSYLKKPCTWNKIDNIRRDLKDKLQGYLESRGHKSISGNLWNAVSTLVMVRIILLAREENWDKDADIVAKFFHEMKRTDLAGAYNKKAEVLSLYSDLYDFLKDLSRKDIYTLSYFKLESVPAGSSRPPFIIKSSTDKTASSAGVSTDDFECSVCGSNDHVIENGAKFVFSPGEKRISREQDVCSTCIFVSLLTPAGNHKLGPSFFLRKLNDESEIP